MIKDKKFFFPIFILVVFFVIYGAKDLIDIFSIPDIEKETAIEMYTTLGGEEGEVPVVLFMTTWCPACMAAKDLLDREQIPYVLADIENNKQASQYFFELTKGRSQGIPQLIVSDSLILGFRPATIVQAYRNAKR